MPCKKDMAVTFSYCFASQMEGPVLCSGGNNNEVLGVEWTVVVW